MGIQIPAGYSSSGYMELIGGPVSDYPVNMNDYTYGYSFVPLVLGKTGLCVFENDYSYTTTYSIPHKGNNTTTYIMGLRGYSGDIFRANTGLHVATLASGSDNKMVLTTAAGWYFGIYAGAEYISSGNSTGTFTFTVSGSSSETIRSIQAYTLMVNNTNGSTAIQAPVVSFTKSGSTYTVSYSTVVSSTSSYAVYLCWIAFTGY